MKNITKKIFLNAIVCPTLGWLMGIVPWVIDYNKLPITRLPYGEGIIVIGILDDLKIENQKLIDLIDINTILLTHTTTGLPPKSARSLIIGNT